MTLIKIMIGDNVHFCRSGCEVKLIFPFGVVHFLASNCTALWEPSEYLLPLVTQSHSSI